jgi:hypothetical protein
MFFCVNQVNDNYLCVATGKPLKLEWSIRGSKTITWIKKELKWRKSFGY